MICFVHIGIWFNLFLLPLLIFFFHKENTKIPILSQCEVPMCFMCSLPVKHATGTGFLTIPPAIWFCFSLSFLFIWHFAYIVPSFLSAAQSAQSRERTMQAGFSFSSSALSCVLYLPRNSVPPGVVWLRVKKYKCPPTCLPSSTL